MIIDLLPGWLATYIPVFSLLAVGYVVEKHYVSRVTMFTNSLALVVFVLSHDVSWYVSLYSEIGLIAGLVGFQAYRKSKSMSGFYYDISAIFYSSAPIAVIIISPELRALFSVILASPDVGVALTVFFVFALNTLALMSDSSLIYKGQRPVRVNEFITDAEFRFPNERSWYSVSDWFEIK